MRRSSSKDEDVRGHDFTTAACVLFPELFDRPLTATLDVPNASSGGGAELLKIGVQVIASVRRIVAATADGVPVPRRLACTRAQERRRSQRN